jgi:hypothetical protein
VYDIKLQCRHREVYQYNVSILLLGQNVTMLIHTLTCMETFSRWKYLICNICCHTVSNLPLSDLDTAYSYIFFVDTKVANYDHLFIYHTIRFQCQTELINTYCKFTFLLSVNVISCITIRVALFPIGMWQSWNLGFIIKHTLNKVSVLYSWLHMHYAGTVVVSFILF